MKKKKGFTISQFVVICAVVILAIATICGVMILENYLNSADYQTARENKEVKLEDIDIQVDGLTFTIKEKYGDTVKQIAKQRQAHCSSNCEKTEQTIILDIDDFLERPYSNTMTRIQFRNKSNTFFFFFIESPNDGVRHEANYKLADSSVSVSFNIRDHEIAYIDNLKIQANKTTRDDLRLMFDDIKIQENDSYRDFATHIAKYKGREISFSYQNGIIAIDIRNL